MSLLDEVNSVRFIVVSPFPVVLIGRPGYGDDEYWVREIWQIRGHRAVCSFHGEGYYALHESPQRLLDGRIVAGWVACSDF